MGSVNNLVLFIELDRPSFNPPQNWMLPPRSNRTRFNTALRGVARKFLTRQLDNTWRSKALDYERVRLSVGRCLERFLIARHDMPAGRYPNNHYGKCGEGEQLCGVFHGAQLVVDDKTVQDPGAVSNKLADRTVEAAWGIVDSANPTIRLKTLQGIKPDTPDRTLGNDHIRNGCLSRPRPGYFQLRRSRARMPRQASASLGLAGQVSRETSQSKKRRRAVRNSVSSA